MRALRIILALVVLGLWLGCSGEKPNASGSKEIVISSPLKDYGLGANISSIILAISGDGFESFTRELEITDGEATGVVDVPLGEHRTFEMTAFDAEDVALYRGSTSADVFAGSVTEVIIHMSPLVPMIRVSPMFTTTDISSPQSVRIYVHNVDSLFGVSLRLEYDTSVVTFASASAGSLFDGEDPIFFTLARPGYLAIAYTLKGNQSPQGVSDDGSVAIIQFTPRAAGRSYLRIPALTASLVDWQGNALPRSGNLYIEEGEFEVEAP